ncbi:thioredoxin family protein [Telmatocola sphagniphila]|uniref:Thioredoxin family protein n=1 Tax=Telmatocola sphagniphila TaxID=1123043 RepID=A0A8E6EX70_9BACT|nr:thioredoxin family protein [Telmatocola sphagniphila]QVL30941.1 thioredoxin family protein [Telmatocola sphagniphila]
MKFSRTAIFLACTGFCVGLTGCAKQEVASTPSQRVVTSEPKDLPAKTSSESTPEKATAAVPPSAKDAGVKPNKEAAPEKASTGDAPFYTVAHYDEMRNPAKDLEDTIQRAKKENKRILVQVGGDWCPWCKILTAFLEKTPALNKVLTDNFLLMKVTWTEEQHNEEFLSKYPAIKGYPHIYVLDTDGKLLKSKNTDELEKGSSYSEEAILKFLTEWTKK